MESTRRSSRRHKHSNALTNLLVAMKENNYGDCERLLNDKVDVNESDDNNDSLLTIAAVSGSTEIVRLLIKHHPELDSRNSHGSTALYLSTQDGNFDIVKLLVTSGCDMDIAGERGYYPLHVAVAQGYCEIVELLIQSGCNVNTQDRDLCTPLLLAAMKGSEYCVDRLIQAGCHLDVRDKHGQTALYHASVNGELEILNMLVKAGCDVNLQKTAHDTPLIASIKAGHSSVAMAIIEAGCDVNKPGHHGNTPIHAALHKMYERCGPMVNYGLIPNTDGVRLIEALAKAGCDLDTPDTQGRTPLYQAAALALFELTRVLVTNGCSLTSLTHTHDSILHAAVHGKHPAIVELLIQAGCDVNAVNTNNETCLYQAVNSWTDTKVIELLLNAKAQVNIQESVDGNTALHRALIQNRTPVALMLLDAGGDIQCENRAREDAVYLSCFHGNHTVLSHLTVHKDFSAHTNKYSRLPLHAAVSKNHTEVVEILVGYGTDLNQIDSNGRSVIQLACEENSESMVHYLLTHGADPDAHSLVKFRRCCVNATDRHPHFHLEPLFIAMKHQNISILRELLHGYYLTPVRVVTLLSTILSGTPEIQAHYPPEMRREILTLFDNSLCRVKSLQKLCVGVIRQTWGDKLQDQIKLLGLPRKMCDIIMRKLVLY